VTNLAPYTGYYGLGCIIGGKLGISHCALPVTPLIEGIAHLPKVVDG